MQDQTHDILEATTSPSAPTFVGFAPYVTYITARDLFGANLSSVEATVRSSIRSYATLNVAASSNATTLAIQEHLLTLQADLIFNNADTLPIVEIFVDTGAVTDTILVPVWLLLPFGRGSVHISSASPLNFTTPNIDPNFFMNPFDAAVQAAAARFTRRIFTTAPLSRFVGTQIAPSLEEVPEDASDEVWLAWLKSVYSPNWHPIGTAAMMSKELGGVVDSELKLYGSSNVRIVDASVVPWEVCGHPTSTLYALAEKAADIIKASRWI